MVAALARRFGDLDIAEEAAAEAFATAVERWPADGVPPNPGAWLTTTATRKAIDRIRRESKRDDKQQEARVLYDDAPAEPLGAIDDDRLRLLFTCCHPALSMEARVALTLRMVGGLTVPEIARAFLVQESTVGQRITRAKAKIKAARIPWRVPSAEDLPARVSGVLAVLFLVFNEGYLATGPDAAPVRADLTARGDPAHPPGPCPAAGGRRGRRAARADAADRGPPPRPGLAGRRARHPRRAGPRRLGRRDGRRGPPRWSASAWPPGWHPAATRCSPRSTPCTPPPATCATPTGRRSSRSTTSWSASTRRRSSRSTGRSRSPSSTGPEVALAAVDRLRRAGRLPRLPRHPRRPAAPAGPQRGVTRGVRPGHRAGRQHRRDRLPHPPPRPAGVVRRLSPPLSRRRAPGCRRRRCRRPSARRRRRPGRRARPCAP